MRNGSIIGKVNILASRSIKAANEAEVMAKNKKDSFQNTALKKIIKIIIIVILLIILRTLLRIISRKLNASKKLKFK